MTQFTVVYDACVLYPAALRDFLMHLAMTNLFRARWSEMIHDEWTHSVLEDRPDLQPSQLARTRQLMDAHVLDSVVTGFESLIPSLLCQMKMIDMCWLPRFVAVPMPL